MSEPVKHQQQGVSLRAFAESSGIREGQLLRYAKQGRILGARKHPLTKKWWIYPPAKLLFPDSSAFPVRRQPALAKGTAGALAPSSAVPPAPAEFMYGHAAPEIQVLPGVLPDIFAAPGVLENMKSVKLAASETHYPVVLSGAQIQLMERAISLAIDEAIGAMSDEPGGRHEIKPSLDAYNQLYRMLKASKAAHKMPNEERRGVEF